MIHLIVSLALVAGTPAKSGHPAGVILQASQAPKPATATQAPVSQATAKPAAPSKADTSVDPVSDAYFEFLMGRHYDAAGDTDAALKAFRRALVLDPKSSQITSELAEVYARQGQVTEAIDLANAALKLDANNWDAHRILGMIYSELASREERSTGNAPTPATVQQAIDHLEKSLADDRPEAVASARLTLGRIYVRQNSYDKAIVVLKQLLADNPWLPQGVAMLAQAYTSAGKPADAIALLKDAVEEEPSFYSALADAYDRQQMFAEAAAAYEKASQQNPRDTDLKTRWAAALLNNPNATGMRRARDLLLDVTKTSPNATWPLYLLSRSQRELDDLEGAERSARRILAISPNSLSGAHALAQVFESRRQYAQIVETLEPIVAQPAQKGREGDTVLLLTHLGFAYLELGRGADAVAGFERASQLIPADTTVRIYLAQALVMDRKYDRALTIVREQRKGREEDARLARLEADALRGQGKFEAGVAVLRPVAEAKGAGSLGVLTLSEYYASEHRYADAAAVLKAARERFSGDLNVQFQYGAMLERLKQFDEAERVFRQVIGADANFAAALNYLGYTLVDRGQRLEEAVALIQRALKLDPYNGSYLDSLGWAQFKLKQFDLAEAALRTAAGQLGRDSVVQDHFGDVLAAKGRFAEAVDAWRRSLAGDGELIDRATIERKIRDAQPRIGKE